MARRRKGLSEEEAALWQQVARTARPLHPAKVPPVAPPPPPSPSPPRPAPEGPQPPEAAGFAALLGDRPGFRVGEAADPRRPHDLSLPLADRLRQGPPRMDSQAFRRLTRGKTQPEARIDLHGLTLAEAHPVLIRFVLSAQARGLRLVLVITGKGSRPGADHGPIPVRAGALRHQVPHWLHQAPLGPQVLQVTPAHLRHGGEGAYYVYLRRLR